jgi:hypothetical protein
MNVSQSAQEEVEATGRGQGIEVLANINKFTSYHMPRCRAQ